MAGTIKNDHPKSEPTGGQSETIKKVPVATVAQSQGHRQPPNCSLRADHSHPTRSSVEISVSVGSLETTPSTTASYDVHIMIASCTNCSAGIHASIEDTLHRILRFRARTGIREDCAALWSWADVSAVRVTWTSGSTALTSGSTKTSQMTKGAWVRCPTAPWAQVGELQSDALGNNSQDLLPYAVLLGAVSVPCVTELEQHSDRGNYLLGGIKKGGLDEKRYLALAAFSSKIVKSLMLTQHEQVSGSASQNRSR